MLVALTRGVSPNLADCEISFIDRQPIDYNLALQQHKAYCDALKSCGVKVKQLPADSTYPDSCFVEDTAIVVDEVAVITRLGAASRQGEAAAIEPELALYRELAHIYQPATIEGGDVLQVGKTLFVGLSQRTNTQGVEALAHILEPYGYTICPVTLNDCLHLKSACTAIDSKTLLINPDWVDLKPFREFNLLFTPPEEPWGANTIRVGETVFLQAGFPQTAAQVQKHHPQIQVLDISEFNKAEAALSCLSIIFGATVR